MWGLSGDRLGFVWLQLGLGLQSCSLLAGQSHLLLAAKTVLMLYFQF